MTTCGCVARWGSSSAATARCCPASSPISRRPGRATVTVELAVAWARLPERIKPITVDFRLSAVRGFARYLHAIDPATRSRRLGCSPSRGGDQRPTSTHRTRSPRCWSRPGGCGRRCGRPPTGRCSGCWLRPACASGEAMALTRERRRPGRGRAHDPAREVRPDAAGAAAPVGHRRAARLRQRPGTGSARRHVSIGSSCRSPGGRCGVRRPIASSAMITGLIGSAHRHRPPARPRPAAQLRGAHPHRRAPQRRGHLRAAAGAVHLPGPRRAGQHLLVFVARCPS